MFAHAFSLSDISENELGAGAKLVQQCGQVVVMACCCRAISLLIVFMRSASLDWPTIGLTVDQRPPLACARITNCSCRIWVTCEPRRRSMGLAWKR